MKVFEHIKKLQQNNSLSKHEQLVQGFLAAIVKGDLKIGDKLPSVNVATKKINVARETLFKAYEDLKSRGLIQSKRGVGYFLVSESVNQTLKVMVLLNALNAYQEVLYNTLIEKIEGENISVDIFLHNCNPTVFQSIMKDNIGKYARYIITPFDHEIVEEIIEQIDKEKLLIAVRDDYKKYSANYVVQDFIKGIQKALGNIQSDIKKYSEINLVFNEAKGHPKELKEGFTIFCKKNKIKHDIIKTIEKENLEEAKLYLVVEDSDMIKVIDYSEEKGLKIGAEVGLISYNESPLKRIIRGGITVVSTDFTEMGYLIAEWLKTGRKVKNIVDTKIIKRDSI